MRTGLTFITVFVFMPTDWGSIRAGRAFTGRRRSPFVTLKISDHKIICFYFLTRFLKLISKFSVIWEIMLTTCVELIFTVHNEKKNGKHTSTWENRKLSLFIILLFPSLCFMCIRSHFRNVPRPTFLFKKIYCAVFIKFQ